MAVRRCGAAGIYIHELGKGVLKVTGFRYQTASASQSPDELKDRSAFKSRLTCLERGKNAYWEKGVCVTQDDKNRPRNMRERAR